MPAQQASIQLRCSAADAPSRWASSRAHREIVIMADKLMSSESAWPLTTQKKQEPSTSAA